MYFSDAPEWLAFAYGSRASIYIVAVIILTSSVGCERLKVRILSKVFAMVGTHHHNKSLYVDAASPYGRNESIKGFPFAIFVGPNVTIEALGEQLSLFRWDR